MPTDEELAARFGDEFPLLLADERRMFRSAHQMERERRSRQRALVAPMTRVNLSGLRWVAAGVLALLSIAKLRT